MYCHGHLDTLEHRVGATESDLRCLLFPAGPDRPVHSLLVLICGDVGALNLSPTPPNLILSATRSKFTRDPFLSRWSRVTLYCRACNPFEHQPVDKRQFE
jgi:hypothetical protein